MGLGLGVRRAQVPGGVRQVPIGRAAPKEVGGEQEQEIGFGRRVALRTLMSGSRRTEARDEMRFACENAQAGRCILSSTSGTRSACVLAGCPASLGVYIHGTDAWRCVRDMGGLRYYARSTYSALSSAQDRIE